MKRRTFLGAAITVIALFLPANENPGFSTIDKNTLIQQSLVTWSVVIFGAVAHIEPIRLWRKEFGDSITGNEVCEDSQR